SARQLRFMAYFARIVARIVAGVAFLALVVSLGPAPAAADQIVDQVVATVDGDPITMHDLTKYAAAAGVQLPPDDSPGSMEIKRHILENLIGEKLVDHEMSTIEVDDDQVDRFIAQFEAGNHITDAELRAQLAQHGISYESYRKRARQEVQKMTMIEQQVRDKITISKSQIEVYYRSHLSEFSSTQERYRLAQILVAFDPVTAPPMVVQAARAKAEGL